MNRCRFLILWMCLLCAASVCGQHKAPADSISANGTVPTMGWDTTAATTLANVKRLPQPKSRCFNLHGQCVPSQFRGVLLENNHKTIIKR